MVYFPLAPGRQAIPRFVVRVLTLKKTRKRHAICPGSSTPIRQVVGGGLQGLFDEGIAMVLMLPLLFGAGMVRKWLCCGG